VAFGGAFADTFGRLVCEGRPRFFALDILAVWFYPQSQHGATLVGYSANRLVGTPTYDAPRRVSAIKLRVSKALAKRVL